MTDSFNLAGTYKRKQGAGRIYAYTIHGTTRTWEGLVRHGEQVKGVVGGTFKSPVANPGFRARILVETAIENLIQMRE